MAAFYLHLGPHARYVRACAEEQVASIDSGRIEGGRRPRAGIICVASSIDSLEVLVKASPAKRLFSMIRVC